MNLRLIVAGASFAAAALALAGCSPSVSFAQSVSDVQGNHWARAAVQDVVTRNVMDAPAGKFDGERKVTRTELAITLARFARSFEKNAWPKAAVATAKSAPPSKSASDSPVSRYELAAVLSKVGRYAVHGIPPAAGKSYLASEALPDRPKVEVPRSDPAFESVTYLVQNRMAFGPSVVLKPGLQPVKPDELSFAIAAVVAGINDRYTDEPQLREGVAPPPHKH